MYVNELTQDYGGEGRAAVAELLRRGEAIGAFPAPGASLDSRLAPVLRMRDWRGCLPREHPIDVALYPSVNAISCAPSQRNFFPSGRRFSFPSTIVAKWLPASAPAFEAKLT